MSEATGTKIEAKGAALDFLSAFLADLIIRAEQEREIREKIWEEHYKNYNSVTGRKFYQGRANLHVPVSFELVETYVPRLVNGIYSQPVPFDVRHRGMDPEDETDAQIKKSLLAYQLESEIKFRKKLPGVCRSACMYGTTFGKVIWRSEKSTRIRRSLHKKFLKDPETGDFIKNNETGENMFDFDIKEDEVEVVEYEGNDVIPIDNFSMFVDELTPDNDINRGRYVIHRDLKTWEEIRALYGDDVPESLFAIGEGKLEEEKRDAMRTTGSTLDNEQNQSDSRLRFFQHDEIWFDWDFEKDGLDRMQSHIRHKNCVAVVIDKKTVVRGERNPFWHGMKPFLSWGLIPRPHEFFAQGLLDSTRKLQYELNDTRNQAMDWRSRAMNQITIVGRAAGIKDKQMVFRQAAIWRVNDVTQVKALDMPNILGLAQATEGQIEENMRNASGATRALQGVPTQGIRSATEQRGLETGGELRIGAAVEGFELQWFEPQLFMMHMNNQQFLRHKKEINLLQDFGFNTEGFKSRTIINPEDLIGDLEFIFSGSKGMALEGVKGRMFLDFFQLALQLNPSLQTNQEVVKKIMYEIWTNVFKLEPTKFGKIFGDQPLEQLLGMGLKDLLTMAQAKQEAEAGQEPSAGQGGTPNVQGQQVPRFFRV